MAKPTLEKDSPLNHTYGLRKSVWIHFNSQENRARPNKANNANVTHANDLEGNSKPPVNGFVADNADLIN